MKMCNILIFKQKKVNILFWFGSGFLKSKSDKSFTEIQSPIHVHYKIYLSIPSLQKETEQTLKILISKHKFSTLKHLFEPLESKCVLVDMNNDNHLSVWWRIFKAWINLCNSINLAGTQLWIYIVEITVCTTCWIQLTEF